MEKWMFNPLQRAGHGNWLSQLFQTEPGLWEGFHISSHNFNVLASLVMRPDPPFPLCFGTNAVIERMVMVTN